MGQSDEHRSVVPAPISMDVYAGPDEMVVATTADERAFTVRALARPDAVAEPSATLEAQLLSIAAGDPDSFRDLFLHWAPRAKTYLIQQGASPSTAEELAISALIEIWRAAGSFNPSEQAGATWIFQRLRDVVQRRGSKASPVRS